VEDFLTLWTAPSSHILPLRRFIENVVDSDLRSFFASSCFKILMTQESAPINCRKHYTEGPMLPTPKFLQDAFLQSQGEGIELSWWPWCLNTSYNRVPFFREKDWIYLTRNSRLSYLWVVHFFRCSLSWKEVIALLTTVLSNTRSRSGLKELRRGLHILKSSA